MFRQLRFAAALCGMLIVSAAFGQAQADWWYFGSNAGIQFTAGPPAPTAGGQVNTVEGSATISNAAGQLLFYTDGITVWNRNHVVMTNGNGLMGNPSSTQSGVIVQKPGSTTVYYIFTCDAQAGANGLRWSEVDMTLSAGLGAVTANKNILLYTPTTERICAIKHCNNTDVWVVTHHWGSNQFRAYLVTAAGVNPVAVTSNVGASQSGSNTMTIGYLKVSPDGTKLCMASRYTSAGGQPGFVELFDFNNTSGAVTNGFTLGNYAYSYGIEFSSNSQYLYVNSSQPGRIYQLNMCAGSNAAIIASAVQIGTSTSGWIGGMQLGPDGKIYMARYLVNWLGVINSPNTAGAGCNYVDNGLSLGAMMSQLGIPNFLTNYLRTPPNIQSTLVANTNCLTANFTYTVTAPGGCSPSGAITSVLWNFGDPGSGPNNTSTQTSPQHIFSGSGTYSITLITNHACYSDTSHASITVTACGVTASIQSAAICSGGCTNVQITQSGGTGPFTYTWSPNIGNGPGPYSVCPTVTTVYSCTVTDASATQSVATATVTVNPPVTLSPTSIAPTCNGGNNGSATVNPGGTGPFTYSWNSTPVQNTQTATNLAAGSYNVTVTDANGCQQVGSITVTQPPAILVSTTSTAPICTACNGAIIAGGSGGTGTYTYSWNTTPVQNTSSINNVCAGNYNVTVTDGNGCSVVQPVALTAQVTPISMTTSNTSVSCNGGCNGTGTALPNNGTAPYTYSWSSGGNASTENNLCAGSYNITITDVNGCTATQAVNITQPTPITLSTSSVDPICTACNGSADVISSGGTVPYTYAWTSGGSGSTENNLCAGAVSVTVTDANGCTQTANYTLNAIVTPLTFTYSTVDATCSASCNGSATATTPSNGTGPYTYAWSSGGSNATENGLCAGNYNITVTDVNGCTATQAVAITQPSALTLATGTTSPSCFSLCDGSANVTASNGTGPYTYSWSSGGTGTTESNLCAGNYNITVTDANNCTVTQAVTVTQPPGMTLAMSSAAPVCTACNGSATVTTSGGSAPYSYSWNTGGINATEGNLCAGSYTVDVTDANGCPLSASVTLTANMITVTSTSAVTNATCNGDCNGIASVTPTDGTAPYTYAWTSGGSSATETGLCAGSYTVDITDVNGCLGSQTVTVTQPTVLSLIANPGSTICAGTTANLLANASGGTPNYTYTWTPGPINGGNVNVTPAATTTYTVNATDANGCACPQQTVTVNVNPLPTVAFTSDIQSGCVPVCVTFTDNTSGAQSQTWNFGDGNTATGGISQHCYPSAGQYNVTLTVTDNNGCINTVVMPSYVNAYPVPSAGFTYDPPFADLLNPTITFSDASTGAGSFFWSFGDINNSSSTQQNPMFSYPDSGFYQVTHIVSNSYGCSDTTSDIIHINGIQTLYAPNAFTPNHDGLNDVFNVKGMNLDPNDFQLLVYDRWGNLIFTTNDLNAGWDGHANGGDEIAQIDVYVWKVRGRSLIDLHEIFAIGSVSLIR